MKTLSRLRMTAFLGFALMMVLVPVSGVLASPVSEDPFSRIGADGAFEWAPPGHPAGHVYDILYFIPKSITAGPRPMRAVIYLHGGGNETLSREGSMKVAQRNMNLNRHIADSMGFVLIIPSGTGLNWGGHTVGFVRDLTTFVKSELNVDADRIGLVGHSMGGMGITRAFPYLADQFAFMVPQASGMDPLLQVEQRLNKLFNVPYVHLQGLNETKTDKEDFTIFIDRLRSQEKKMVELETFYGKKSRFKAVFHNGTHAQDSMLLIRTLSELFSTPRDLLQKELWGSFRFDGRELTENKIQFRAATVDRYFWVQAVDYEAPVPSELHFYAQVDTAANHITVSLLPGDVRTKTLRIFLAPGLVNLSKPITIEVNDTRVTYVSSPKDPVELRQLTGESVFTDYVDVSLE